VLLVAGHPWDIDGAARVRMATGWVNRTDRPYPRPIPATSPLLAPLGLSIAAGSLST